MGESVTTTLQNPFGTSFLERFLYWGIQIGIFLILLTPFVMSNASVFPAIFPKVIYFRVLVELIFLFYLILLLRNAMYLPKLTPLFLSVFVFIQILAFSTFKGINPERSFWGTVERGEGLILFLHLLLFFVVLVGVFREKQSWMKLLKLAVLVRYHLREEGVEVAERRQNAPVLLALFLSKLLDPLNRPVHDRIHRLVVGLGMLAPPPIPDLSEVGDILRRDDAGLQYLVLELVEALRVSVLADRRRLVVRLESCVDILFLVREVEDEGAGLAGGSSVEAREGLDRLHARQFLHHIHGLEQGLVKAGLVS